MLELLSNFDAKSVLIVLLSAIMLFSSIFVKSNIKRLKALEDAEKIRIVAETNLVSRQYIETQFEKSNIERKSMHDANMRILDEISKRVEILAVHELKLQNHDVEIASLRHDRHEIAKEVQRHEGKLDFISRQLVLAPRSRIEG